MKIAIIGTGYVGLVTGACFAEVGNEVVCVDSNQAKVTALRRGRVPIHEPGLEAIFHRTMAEDRLSFTADLASGLAAARVIVLALPTPPDESGAADLSSVLAVADQLGELLRDYVVIINKSTVPVGTAEQVRAAIAKTATVEFDVVSNPEFLREGFAINDFMAPDRIVIGSSSARARALLEDLYEPFVRQAKPIYHMDERSAEMTKYAANSFLATKISFMNEIANLCELTGADVEHVRRGIGSDERIGQRFLFPGIGYGGSCFPKDVKALQRTATSHGYDFKILESVAAVNERQKRLLFARIKDYYAGDLHGRKFAVWGLAFKPDTDDIREAPAIYLIDDLLAAGANVMAYDPEANLNARQHYRDQPNFAVVDNQYAALDGADALLIATEWPVFYSPNFETVKQQLKAAVIFDGRNLYQLADMQAAGFDYVSIGRQAIAAR